MSYAFTRCLEQQTAFELAEESFISFLESLNNAVLHPLNHQGLDSILSGIRKLLQFHIGYRSAICPPTTNNIEHGRGRHKLKGTVAFPQQPTMLNERVFVYYATFPSIYGQYIQSIMPVKSLQTISMAVARGKNLRNWLQSQCSTVTLYDAAARQQRKYGSFAE